MAAVVAVASLTLLQYSTEPDSGSVRTARSQQDVVASPAPSSSPEASRSLPMDSVGYASPTPGATAAQPNPRAFLVVRSNVADDRLSIDDKEVGQSGPESHEVEPGSHTVTVEREGYETESLEIRVAAGETKVVRVRLVPSATATPSPATAASSQATGEGTGSPIVLIETSMGAIEVELFPESAPVSVSNFLEYVGTGYYDGTTFHRVISGFMIQGGGFDATLTPKPGARAPIRNEATNGLKNRMGTLAMARTGVVDSATSQFFINTVDNPFLDHTGRTAGRYGYAVFGRVIRGIDVVKAIERVPTGPKGQHQDVPLRPVVLKRVSIKR